MDGARRSFGHQLLLIERLNEYTASDRRNMITASPTTISRFGPSGSLINKNTTLEHTMDKTPRIINEAFFDLRCMVLGFPLNL